MMRTLITALQAMALAIALVSASAAQPVVSNVAFLQQPAPGGGTEVVVTYDLASSGSCRVTLLFSANSGDTFVISPAEVTGDIGLDIQPGNGRQIVWRIADDLPEWNLATAVARIVADEIPAPTLSITGSVPGGVSQDPTQLVTFIFSEAVVGFDESLVVVTNGTKGAFTTIYPTLHTLEVTANAGGLVTVEVPPGAVTSLATGAPNLAATYSGFYQDIWTILLPGGVPLEMIRIPAGTYLRGAPDDEISRESLGTDESQHEVILTRDFYMARTEITQAQYTAFDPFINPQDFSGPNVPVQYVDFYWFYTFWLSGLQSWVTETAMFDLPTEAEWEYACRAGTTTRFHFGEGIAADEACALGAGRELHMWYCGNSPSVLQPVAQKLPNAWGLYDMHGNMAEWVRDPYAPYPSGSVVDPGVGPFPPGGTGTLRGGSFQDQALHMRSAARYAEFYGNFDPGYGYRLIAYRD